MPSRESWATPLDLTGRDEAGTVKQAALPVPSMHNTRRVRGMLPLAAEDSAQNSLCIRKPCKAFKRMAAPANTWNPPSLGLCAWGAA